MKLEEALPALREGKKIRRKSWDECDYIQYADNTFFWACFVDSLFADDILAEDWEVCE